MAQMVPTSMPPKIPGHIARVWRQLKAIDDPDLVCRISYQINTPTHPDFLLIYKKQTAVLLTVCGATTEELNAYLQNDLFEKDHPLKDEFDKRHSADCFTDEILEAMGAKQGTALKHWLLFPTVSDRTISKLSQTWQGAPRKLLGKGQCNSRKLRKQIISAADHEFDQQSLNLIIGRFSPETAIPKSWVTRNEVLAKNQSAPIQTDFLLDYDQEDAVKRDLELSSEAFKAASSGSVRLVTGTAGCGKTLILLFRARLSASLDTSQKVLVLMHNKPLRADLANRAKEIGMSKNIEWKTFYSWIRSLMDFELIPPRKRTAFIETKLRERGLNERLKIEFLLDEFEWISDNAPQGISIDWYLSSPRVGRRRALHETQRREVYRLYVDYRMMLDNEGLQDWSVIPRNFLQKIINGELETKQYHTIYIDEAQFFAPVWFQCIKMALHPEYGRLFMVADPTQGFLRSGQSWVQILGGDMRGRSQRLIKPYRNTKPIMALAKRFYMSRSITEEDEVNIPSEKVIDRMPEGVAPQLIKVEKQPDQTLIISQLKQLFQSKLNPGNLLIIDASGSREDAHLDYLQKEFPNLITSASSARDRSKVRITSINACTGIESPVVLLFGIDRMLEQEQSLSLDEIAREELIKRNTKKLFVAITRASQKIIILYKHDSTKKILEGA